jgi:hypothetical protein
MKIRLKIHKFAMQLDRLDDCGINSFQGKKRKNLNRLMSACDEYLYWYSIQGEYGHNVEECEHWIKKRHLQF